MKLESEVTEGKRTNFMHEWHKLAEQFAITCLEVSAPMR
jgi:hypothetical protein